MTIDTERLHLREYTWEDRDDLAAIISDPETMRYYPAPYDAAGVDRWIRWNLNNYRDLGFGLFVIERREDGAFLGDCGITIQIINHKLVAEIGYHLNRRYHHCGYAAEAAAACRDWIFTHAPFNTVYSYMNSENTASRRVAERCGMHFVEEYEEDGVPHTVMAITRAEWQALSSSPDE